MDKREKVISGLECCLPMTTRNGLADCKQCPYDRKITLEGGVTECCHDLLADALALLKAQEPRVMTLEELRMNEVYWAEQEDVYRPWPIAMHHIRNAGLLDGPVYQDWIGDNYNAKEYGIKWRCWTSRPTDEQREKVKWDE